MTKPDVPTLLQEAREALIAAGWAPSMVEALVPDRAVVRDWIHHASGARCRRPQDDAALRALCQLYTAITEPSA